MIGKIISIQGKKMEIELDEPFNQEYLRLLAHGEENYVDVKALDNRGMSAKQNALSHALIADVGAWQGQEPYLAEMDLKTEYYRQKRIAFQHHKATKSEANAWINFLIDFVLNNKVPLPKIYSYLMDDTAWFYYCLKYRVCCICMDRAEIAHYDAVGMGRNRRKIDHSAYRFMALCHKHHKQQHDMGVLSFVKLYQIKLVRLSDEERKKLRIGG